jgi:DNA polymerase I-like protein with 3'-5' exonuclease and polymerase domains
MLTKDGSKTDFANMPIEEVAQGNALDVFYTLDLYYLLEESLSEHFLKFHSEVIEPLNSYLALQTYNGIVIDTTKLVDMESSLTEKKQEALERIFTIYPEGKNINSSKDLREFLYCDEQINSVEGSFNVFWPETTPKGAPSTNADSLSFLLKEVKKELAERGHE